MKLFCFVLRQKFTWWNEWIGGFEMSHPLLYCIVPCRWGMDMPSKVALVSRRSCGCYTATQHRQWHTTTQLHKVSFLLFIFPLLHSPCIRELLSPLWKLVNFSTFFGFSLKYMPAMCCFRQPVMYCFLEGRDSCVAKCSWVDVIEVRVKIDECDYGVVYTLPRNFIWRVQKPEHGILPTLV